MKRLILAAALLAPAVGHAQSAPEMVLLPRQTAEMALQWIARPDATTAVQLYASLQACLASNPHGGVTTHSGQDQCPATTDALADREKRIADLTAEAAIGRDLKVKADAAAKPSP